MLTIEGTYKDGQIVLTETPTQLSESKVLVTFLETKEINLAERGIGRAQAAQLKNKFSAVAEDWNRPEMDVYDVD